MNERIKELALHAGGRVAHEKQRNEPGVFFSEDAFEKFTRLITNESWQNGWSAGRQKESSLQCGTHPHSW